MEKPKCPRCGSSRLYGRDKTQDCKCARCRFTMPSPWDSPEEYKALFENMNPSIKEYVICDAESGEELDRVTFGGKKDINQD